MFHFLIFLAVIFLFARGSYSSVAYKYKKLSSRAIQSYFSFSRWLELNRECMLFLSFDGNNKPISIFEITLIFDESWKFALKKPKFEIDFIGTKVNLSGCKKDKKLI